MEFAVAVMTAFFIIFSIKLMGNEDKHWCYPLILMSLPFFHIGFALYGDSTSVAIKEALWALPVFGIAIYTLVRRAKWLLIIGFASHALWDVIHDTLLLNSGLPGFWAGFCGSIDFIIALYLAYYYYPHPLEAQV